MKRTGFAAIVAAVAVVALGAGVALAGGEKTTVTAELGASPDGDSIDGKVKSGEKVCVKGRKVKVTYQDAPSPKETIGTDEADKKGNYSVALDNFAPPGTYTATAKEVKVDGVTCRKGVGTYEHFGGGGDGGGPTGDPNAPDVP